MSDRRRSGPLPIERVASVADQLATLLEAGVGSSAAWVYAAEGAADPIMHAVGRAAGGGTSVVAALERVLAQEPDATSGPWRALAASWWAATESGASLAPCLRALAGSFRQQGDTERDIGVALAGPTATSRMVMFLPLIGLGFGALLGFDSVGALLGSPIGWVLLVAGVGLMGLGAAWSKRLARTARTFDRSPGVELDLLAVALSGGLPASTARSIADDARARFLGIADLAVDERATRVLDLAIRAGVPAGDLLRSEADQMRRRARSDGQGAAAVLAVRLMLPLGICVLPAFILLGVAPLVLSIVSSTFSEL